MPRRLTCLFAQVPLVLSLGAGCGDDGPDPTGAPATATDPTTSGGSDPTTTSPTTGGTDDATDTTGDATDPAWMTPYCYTVADKKWLAPWIEREQQVLDLVNQARADGADCGSMGKFDPAGPLTMEPRLHCAARKHSRDMGQRGYFSHSSRASGESFDKRVLRFQDRTKVRWLGETIGWGAGDLAEPEQMVQMWMDSPPHRRTILDRRFRIVGIGTWAGEFMGHQGVRIYTADFGG